MKAVTWQGFEDVRVDRVPDPVIQEPTDAIIRVTSTCICGSDLHLYSVLTNFMNKGDILGHEPMGIVEEVGSAIRNLKPGDRVVVPFNIACGYCYMCARGLYAQCETTQVREHGKGAALFGYTKLYGAVPGGQAEYLRVPQAHFGPIKVPNGPPDERYVLLADVLPTAWQAVMYADIPEGGTVAIMGLGPIGHMAARVARHFGARVIGVELVPERLAMAERHGVETVRWTNKDDIIKELQHLTNGRGPDSVIDAAGMEAHGAPVAETMQRATAVLPSRVGAALAERVGIDRLTALLTAIGAVRRGGTLSIIGVYGGAADPLPMLDLFDKGLVIRMGQANVKRWVDDILPLLNNEDPLGTQDFISHRLPLDDAPMAYEKFQKKDDGFFKVMLQPAQ